MNTKLYVDNLTPTVTEDDLRDLFSPYGEVAEVNVPISRASGQSRGFGFVTMVTLEGARSALQALNGKAMGSGRLAVSQAWAGEQRANSCPGH